MQRRGRVRWVSLAPSARSTSVFRYHNIKSELINPTETVQNKDHVIDAECQRPHLIVSRGKLGQEEVLLI